MKTYNLEDKEKKELFFLIRKAVIEWTILAAIIWYFLIWLGWVVFSIIVDLFTK